jgi:hypothetical protein
MADLASSAVTILRISSQTLSNGITLWTKACSVTLTTQGTVTNKILATAFGLSAFEESSSWSKTDNTEVIVAGVSGDRSHLLLKAAGTNAPADFAATYNVYVKGY